MITMQYYSRILLFFIVVPLIFHYHESYAVQSQQWTWQTGDPSSVTVRVEPGFRYDVVHTTRSESVTKFPHDTDLPHQPVTKMRSGRWRGADYSIFRVNPRSRDQGTVWNNQSVTFRFTNGTVVSTPVDEQRPFGLAPPMYQRATQESMVTSVDRAGGFYRLQARDLETLGYALPLHSDAIHIEVDGLSLARDVHDGGDGQLDHNDQLIVYIPPATDRWNSHQMLWVTIDGTRLAPAMTARRTTSGTHSLRSTAVQILKWQHPTIYDSKMAGTDRDHWWSRRLTSGALYQPATLTIGITPTLSLQSFDNVQIAGATIGGTDHQIAIANQVYQWQGSGIYTATMALSQQIMPQVTIVVPQRQGIMLDDQLIDQVVITATVRLNDFQGRGASWQSLNGSWSYALGNLPLQRLLYDISQPAAPQRVQMPEGRNIIIDDQEQHSYALLDSTTIPILQLKSYRPHDLPTTADQIAIAPREWFPLLQPLVTWRKTQGHTLALVDPTDLYARWSFGQLDPEALRRFFQYVSATWTTPPTSILLVGDGTLDPLNYSGYANAQIIPPYLADIDLWIHETACDTCFVQLDGDNPLDDELPDLQIGRLPVRTATELIAVVTKLITYDQQPQQAWMDTVTSLSDNYRSANGTIVTANDFPTLAKQSEALYPPNTVFQRVYYDPYPVTATQIGHERNAQHAYDQTQDYLRSGAAIVQYLGHGSPWQWASTDTSLQRSFLSNVADAEIISMIGQPVILSLTCTTSSFHLPSQRGYGLDEAFVLNPHGAIASWGSSGVGVAHGHDYLQRGFISQLTQPDHTFGAATTAGMWTLWSEGQCCTDALRTFISLGDPLTSIRFKPAEYQTFIPLLVANQP